jgi:hypothetical protein
VLQKTNKNIKTKSFFLCFLVLMMFFPGVQSQDIICNKVGALANVAAAAMQDVLNNRLGGTTALDGALSLVYESYEIAFHEPSFAGCEATMSSDITVNGESLPDIEGTATMTGTFDIAALLERQICITGLEVTELALDNIPNTLMNTIEDALLGNVDVPDLCVDLPGDA